MIRKIAAAALKVWLILLFVYSVIDGCASLAGANFEHSSFIYVLLFLFFFVGVSLSLQVNVLLLVVLLLCGIAQKYRPVIFIRKMLWLFALNAALVFIYVYVRLGQLFQESGFPRKAGMYYDMNPAIVSKRTFLSNVYTICGLGWYQLRVFYDLLFHAVNRMEQNSLEGELMIISLNCCLSIILLLFFLLCFFIGKKRQDENRLLP